MSGRKRRSLLGSSSADGAPPAGAPEAPADASPAGEVPPADSALPEAAAGASEAAEAALTASAVSDAGESAVRTPSYETEPPPVGARGRRRLVKTNGDPLDDRTGERTGETRRPTPPPDEMSGLVSFDEPPMDAGADAFRRASMPPDPPARRSASRDPDLAYRRPSLEPPDGAGTDTDAEPRLRTEKSRSPFGDLKVVDRGAGGGAKKPASPFFRSAPPEDAQVFESNPGIAAPRRRTTTPEPIPFEKVVEPQKIPRKSATRGAPDPNDSGRYMAPRTKLRVDKAESGGGGHKEPLSWNEVAPNHVWQPGDTGETPAPPPVKRSTMPERAPVASHEVVAGRKPSAAEKPPLESIEVNATPTLPGLFDGQTPPPAPSARRAPSAEPPKAEAPVTPTPPPPPRPVEPVADDDDRGGGVSLLSVIAVAASIAALVMACIAAYAAFTRNPGPSPEVPKPQQVVPAAPRIPLPTEIPPPIEDTNPPEGVVPAEVAPAPTQPPVPGVVPPKPKPRPAPTKPQTTSSAVTEDRGTIKVRSNKHGLIYVNGSAKSFTPDQISLPPGTYTVTVTLPDGPSQSQSVTVKKDRTEPLEFTFP